MRILLIGNYELDRQESMARFCELVRQGLARSGDDVRVLRPRKIVAQLRRGPAAAQKWLGYIDKFVLFPFTLWREAKAFDVVHICDHSNSRYTRYLRGRPNLITCHDLLAVRSALGEFSENPTGWSGRILQRAILRGLQRAQFVACVSQKTKQDLLRLTDRDPDHTSCVSNGLNYPYRPMEPAEAQERVRLLLATQSASEAARPFFLHVGGNQWYKNRLGVLEIFASLRARAEFRGHRLILAGKPFTATMRSFIANHHLCDDVTELRSPANEDLRALYSLAEALVFPSLEEGFGWPILEAQACGCPVFTSSRPPMNEVGGDAARYFDPRHPNDAAAAIAESDGRRASMAEQGIANASRFCADQMLDEYRKLYRNISAPRRATHSRD